MVYAGLADLGFDRGRGARGRYLDNTPINLSIFLDDDVERIDAINLCLLNTSVSVVIVKLCIRSREGTR